jgi:hypothetical protein
MKMLGEINFPVCFGIFHYKETSKIIRIEKNKLSSVYINTRIKQGITLSLSVYRRL